jgi:predicted nucleotidyltransferase
MNSSETFGLSGGTIKIIQEILQSYGDIEEVVVFGSRAKGNYKQGSDIDLAIMNQSFDNTSIPEIKGRFEESDIPNFVDILFYYDVEKKIQEHIKRVGKVIYTKKR